MLVRRFAAVAQLFEANAGIDQLQTTGKSPSQMTFPKLKVVTPFVMASAIVNETWTWLISAYDGLLHCIDVQGKLLQ
jgi:hypothetical protein